MAAAGPDLAADPAVPAVHGPVAVAGPAPSAPPPSRRWPRLLRPALLLLTLALAPSLLRLLVRPAPLLAAVPRSRAVWDERGHLLRLTLAADQQYRLFVPLSRIAPELVEATLLHEDRHFRLHPGVNPVALLRALWTTARGPRRVGGSTITMQLARRLHHIDSRRPAGKLRQIAAALGIELLHGKDEILEAYLNLVPGGRNIEGVGAASLIHFGKPAAALRLPESLALAVVPQSPLSRAPTAEADGGNARLLAARQALFAEWVQRHPAARADEPLVRAPLAVRAIEDLPFLAPHYVDALLAEHRGDELRGTIDLGLQRLVERRVRDYVARSAARGIRNAAVLLVDHRSMAVKALLGSADFGDASIAGQVNGVTARRSPGSALKPFVYALGFEQGVIHPLTMLRDTPTAFAAFRPENFDGRFVGPISASEALVRSRNIPALWVASRLARPSFHEFLRSAGISGLLPEEHYGLALVLGGLEVSMEELVSLYAMLENRGTLRPLRSLVDAPRSAGVKLLSDEAAFLVLDALGKNPRPDRFSDADAASLPPVYWKTGTSFGFRDAWAVGVLGPYAMAVWIGEFSGESNPAFVGVQAAAPLFFELADALRAQAPGSPVAFDAAGRLKPPAHLARVEVCAVSGELPGPHCPHRRTTWFIPGTSPIDACRIHREVLIDEASGRRACAASLRPGQPVRRQVMEAWPSDLLRQFALAGLPRRELPPADPRCGDDGAGRGAAPQITSPLRGVAYSLGEPASGRRQVPLSAVIDGDAREVYWFVDDRFVGRSRRSGTLLYTPDSPGTHRVRAVDDLGRSDARALVIEGQAGRGS